MSYILKQFDTNLLHFDMKKDIDGVSATVLNIVKDNISLLPLDMELSDLGLTKWLKRRAIPSNRAYVQNFLAKIGLNEKDTKGIIDFCKGLSLNDCFWVVEEDFNGNFSENNLYDNKFSNVLSHIAFTGYGSFQKSSLRSSPEFTTNGMLAKCWRRVNGKIVLYKSGTEGFANSGNEPYSEFYASQVAEAMGINFVKYSLSKWKGRLCSTCELFTSKDYSFIPVGHIVKDGGIKAVMEYYKQLGDKFYENFVDMIVFDAVILNTDRHFGNYGFMVDNKTNKICATAPLFDNGLSLLNFALDSDLADWETYSKTRVPATYSNFIELAKQLMGRSQREKLRKLVNFKFQKHSRYNLSNTRIKTIEKMIQNQVKSLL